MLGQRTSIEFKKADKKGVQFVVNRGGTNEKYALNNIRKAKILVVKENLNAFEKIKNSQADIMITDGIEAEYYSQNEKSLCVGFGGKKLTSFDIGFWFREDGPLKKKFDAWLGRKVNRGLIAQMVSQSLGKPPACKYEANCECVSPGHTLRWEYAYCRSKLKIVDVEKDSHLIDLCIKNAKSSDYDSLTACEKNRVWRKKLCQLNQKKFYQIEYCLTTRDGIPDFIKTGP